MKCGDGSCENGKLAMRQSRDKAAFVGQRWLDLKTVFHEEERSRTNYDLQNAVSEDLTTLDRLLSEKQARLLDSFEPSSS